MATDPVNRRAVIITCGMQAFQQLCGFNTLMYYSSTLFEQIGFDQPTAVGLIVSGTNFLFTLFALKYIDIIGRRKIMLWSAPGMIFGLTLAAIAFYCKYLLDATILTPNLSADVLFDRHDENDGRTIGRRHSLLDEVVECGHFLHGLLRCLLRYWPREHSMAARRILLAGR